MYAVGASEANLMYSSGGFKQSEGELMKYRDYMTADLTESPPPSSAAAAAAAAGLARYRSAPSSFFAALLENGGGAAGEGFVDLLGGGGGVPYDMQFPAAAAAAVKRETAAEQQSQSRYSAYEEDIGGVYKGGNITGSNQVIQVQGKIGGLARQTSSPAGFFSNLTVENGFSVMSEVGNFRAANGINGKSSPTRKLNDHLNFSCRQSSSARHMPQIAENGNESGNPENAHLGNGNSSNNFYSPSFQNDTLNEYSYSGLKRGRESEDKFAGYNTMDSQRGDDTNYPNRLTHHLSLPKTSGEMAAIEKYLQFQQDVVPCKIRAKRGFATHPRSIAERVRRTRISDRMKKLQDLFPNMDKQTNTAEMLDLAVEYIKDLQTQVETLTSEKAKCICSK